MFNANFHKKIDRIMVGLFASDGTVSLYAFDLTKVTGVLQTKPEIRLGTRSNNVGIVFDTANEYKVKVEANNSSGRSVCFVCFD